MIFPLTVVTAEGAACLTSRRRSVEGSRTSPHRLAVSTMGIFHRHEPEGAPPSRAAYAAVGIAVRIGFTGLTDSSALLTHFAMMTCPVGRTLARSSTDSMLSTNCG